MSFSFKRVLLKVSGEALGKNGSGFDADRIGNLAQKISELEDIDFALVIGGGNFFRGAPQKDFRRTSADHVGMLATVMNSLIMRDALERVGRPAIMMCPQNVCGLGEPYDVFRARQLLEQGIVVICAGGTGNPFFTTDTAGVLRACELNCQAMFKATNVPGIFSDDPAINTQATFFPKLTYKEAWERRLQVMDLTAMTLAWENELPLVVFAMNSPEDLEDVLRSQGQFSIVRGE